jgi:hypothetical protein
MLSALLSLGRSCAEGDLLISKLFFFPFLSLQSLLPLKTKKKTKQTNKKQTLNSEALYDELCTENLMSLVVQDKLVCQVWFISMGL